MVRKNYTKNPTPKKTKIVNKTLDYSDSGSTATFDTGRINSPLVVLSFTTRTTPSGPGKI